MAGKEKRNLHILKHDVYALGMMAALISFLGFVVENLWLVVTKGYINNRNMNAPFLFGYGLLVLMMYFMLGTPDEMNLPVGMRKNMSRRKKYVVYFFCSMFIVCIGEIILGIAVKMSCGIDYWNYSRIPLHITKYTSIPTSMAFASMITLFMGKCFEPIMSVIMKMDYRVLKVISTILVAVMLADYFISFGVMIKKKGFNLRWKIVFRNLNK